MVGGVLHSKGPGQLLLPPSLHTGSITEQGRWVLPFLHDLMTNPATTWALDCHLDQGPHLPAAAKSGHIRHAGVKSSVIWWLYIAHTVRQSLDRWQDGTLQTHSQSLVVHSATQGALSCSVPAGSGSIKGAILHILHVVHTVSDQTGLRLSQRDHTESIHLHKRNHDPVLRLWYSHGRFEAGKAANPNNA